MILPYPPSVAPPDDAALSLQPARTARFERPPTPAHTCMTTTPATSDRVARTGLLLDMSENAAPQQLAAGDDESGGSGADARVHRAALLTLELAEECSTKMFTESGQSAPMV
mmetsp:Transcript_74358/g.147766  ORF Transcript_74358/g.147766 Transcript_74358/m.147766 type:complete len:112 (+) Transcript_74358:177-512(+)